MTMCVSCEFVAWKKANDEFAAQPPVDWRLDQHL
jgi:hypothetical protein